MNHTSLILYLSSGIGLRGRDEFTKHGPTGLCVIKWKLLPVQTRKAREQWKGTSVKCRYIQFSSVAQSCLTLCNHGLQHTRLPHASPTSSACSNSCPSSRWCHLTILSSVLSLLLPSVFPRIIFQCRYKEPTYGLLTETFFSLLYGRFCKESHDIQCNKQVGWILLCESLSLSIWFN